jgi:hypothetical protein
MENSDSEHNLVSVNAPIVADPVDVIQNSPFSLLLDVICGVQVPQVRGTYEGKTEGAYKNGGKGEMKIAIIVEQNGSDVNVTFQTGTGEQGKGTGTLTGSVVNSISLRSAASQCPGSYEASLKFAGDTVDWSYKGEDCSGPMEGSGTAKKTKP